MGSTFQNFPGLKLDAAVSVGVQAGNDITVTIQAVDRENGNEVGERVAIPWYLSSNANGDALASATSGGAAIGTDGLLIEWTDNLAGLLVTEVDGDADIVLTEAGAGTWYLILVMPDGKLIPSAAITFA